MKLLLIFVLNILSVVCYGQASAHVVLQGDFTREDSIHIMNSYMLAKQAVDQLYSAMHNIWDVAPQADNSKSALRSERWRNDAVFMKWLGEPRYMKHVNKTIRKIHHKFDKKFILEVVKDDEGRCNRYKGAWVVPYGRVKIRLCRNYLNMSDDQSAKFLIHEVGHETGMLYHQDVFNCRDVLQAAAANDDKAKRSPETYAWLAMSYMGLDCNSRGR